MLPGLESGRRIAKGRVPLTAGFSGEAFGPLPFDVPGADRVHNSVDWLVKSAEIQRSWRWTSSPLRQKDLAKIFLTGVTFF